MSKFKPFLFGALFGAGIVFIGLQYHVVQSQDGLRVVPRTPQHALGLAYVDIRNWDTAAWADRPELARALVAHGSTDLVASSVAGGLVESISSDSAVLDQLRGFVNEAPDSGDTDSLFNDSDFAPLNAPSDGHHQDLNTIPFEDARRKRAGDSASTLDSEKRPALAARDFDSGTYQRDWKSKHGATDQSSDVSPSSTQQQGRPDVDAVFGSGGRTSSQSPGSGTSSTPKYGSSTDSGYGTSSTPKYGSSTDSGYGPSSTPKYGSSTDSGYGPSSTPKYGSSTDSGYGPSSTPKYGSSTDSGYGPSSTSKYGSSTDSGYGTSSTPKYGSSTDSGYGTSSTPKYGSSTDSGYGPSSTPKYGSSTDSGYGTSSTSKYGSSTDSGYGTSSTPKYGSSTDSGYGPSNTPKYGSSTDSGYGTSSTPKYGSSTDSGSGTSSTSKYGSSTDSGYSTQDRGGDSDAGTGFSVQQETSQLEDMLFGDDENYSQPSSGKMAPRAQGNGYSRRLEDVTSNLDDRAEQVLKRARSGFPQPATPSYSRADDGATRYQRDATGNGYSGRGSSTFSADAPQVNAYSRDSYGQDRARVQDPLKAVRDGFDPFVE